MAPAQLGKLVRLLKQSYSFTLFCVGGAIYNGPRIRHTSWQTLLTILAVAVIPLVRENCISENVRPVAIYR